MKIKIRNIYNYFIDNNILYLSGSLLFIVLIILANRLAESDDTSFLNQIQPFDNLAEWLNFRYQNWSGRIFAESLVYIFTPINLIFWKISSLAMYAFSVIFMYLIYRLWDSNPSKQTNLYILSIITILPLLMGFETLYYGTFWITGGMAYFWMTTLGLIALYPILYYFKFEKTPKWYFVLVSVVCTIIASSSQEQIGATLLAIFGFVFLCTILKNYKSNNKLKIPYFIIFYIVLAVGSLLVSVLAPGNRLRYNAELTTWLPDFLLAPIIKHVEYGYRWFLEGFINNTGVILVLMWGSMSLLFYKLKNNKKRNYILSAIFMLASILLLSKGHDATKFWFNFNAIWNFDVYKFSYISLIPWSIMTVMSVLAPLLIYARSIKGWLISLLIALSASTMLIMTISPTMYASGWRTLYVGSYILLAVLVLLLSDVFSKYKRQAIYIYFVIIVFALSQFINTFYNMYQLYN